VKVLIAGVGNIFLGDDGFGPEVAARLARGPLPAGVRAEDFGIRGLHLAYELLGGYDALILVDAAARGEEPGTVSLIEPDLGAIPAAAPDDGPPVDAHGMSPDAVFALLKRLGGTVSRSWVIGCEPASLEEGIGLSPPVAAAVGGAVQMARELAAELTTELTSDTAERK
jgi:hydrogenase maturation protease